MHISDKLANENWERNQNWTPKPTLQNSTSICLHFRIEVYRGLDVKRWIKNAVDFLQKKFKDAIRTLQIIVKPSDKK